MYKFIRLIFSTYFVKKYWQDLKSIAKVAILLIVVSWLYGDVVEYMVFNGMSSGIIYVLLAKWVFFAIAYFQVYQAIRRMFVSVKEHELPPDIQQKIDDVIDNKHKLDDGLSRSDPSQNHNSSKAELAKMTAKVNQAIDGKDKLKNKKDSIAEKYNQ